MVNSILESSTKFLDKSLMCRLCMEYHEDSLNIFLVNATNGMELWSVMQDLLDVEVAEGDGLPDTVCCHCLRKLMEFSKFKEMCIKTETKLKRNILVSDLKTNIDGEVDPSESLAKEGTYSVEHLGQHESLERLLSNVVCAPLEVENLIAVKEEVDISEMLFEDESQERPVSDVVQVPLETGNLVDMEEIDDPCSDAVSDGEVYEEENLLSVESQEGVACDDVSVPLQAENGVVDSSNTRNIPKKDENISSPLKVRRQGRKRIKAKKKRSPVCCPPGQSLNNASTEQYQPLESITTNLGEKCEAKSYTCFTRQIGTPPPSPMMENDGGVGNSTYGLRNSPCNTIIPEKLHSHSKRIRNSDMCLYCKTSVLNFSRHIMRNHLDETEVKKIFSLRKNSNERKNLLASLRKKGNFIQNVKGCMRPMRKSNMAKVTADFLPCKHCLGYYARKQLWRHIKKCVENPVKIDNQSRCQAEAQNLLVNNNRIDQKLKEEVFPRMRADEVSLVAKQDPLICDFGAQYVNIHGEKSFIHVTSRKMRELAKLLIEVKRLNPSIKDLFHSLQPKHFDLLVEATKTVARYDVERGFFENPTYAVNIGTSLKQCCDLVMDYALNEEECYAYLESEEVEATLKTMVQLLNSSWKNVIYDQAADDLTVQKWNKVTLISLASDLKLLKEYLSEKANSAAAKLKNNNADDLAYSELLETIFCRVLLLNRRRAGDLQRLPLFAYEMSETNISGCNEFDQAALLTEKVLAQKLKHIVTRGKGSQGVPLLFSSDVEEDIKVILEARNDLVDEDNPYLFGRPHLKTPTCGYQTLEKYANLCGAKNSKSISSTSFRKHIATLTQLLHMSENDIEELLILMGHKSDTHMKSYLSHDNIYQMAKLSKLLMLMEKGDFKGMSLSEIEINKNDELPFEDEDDSLYANYSLYDPFSSLEKETEKETLKVLIPLCPIKKGKRLLVPWTEQQKSIVTSYFKRHIESKIPPKKGECETLIEKYQGVLSNKSWLKIKVFIQNIYKKMT